jgi:DNA-binding Lrp family transcriptional regulator
MYTKIQENQAQIKTSSNFQVIKDLKPRSKLNLVCNFMINQRLFFESKGCKFFASEATIAKTIGCSIRTVATAVRLLQDAGIMQRIRRFAHGKTYSNVYELRPHMRSDSIIEELAPYLPALRNLLCLSMLMPVMAWLKPATENHRPENCTLYLKTKYLLEPLQKKESILAGGMPTLPGGVPPDSGWSGSGNGSKTEIEGGISISPEQNKPKPVQNQWLRTTKDQESLKQDLLKPFQNQNQTRFDYINPKSVADYKEFMTQRLPKLKQNLAGLGMDDMRQAEVIDKQIKAYTNELHYRDREALLKEGFKL